MQPFAHLGLYAVFKVQFPLWVKWVGLPLDFNMSADKRVGSIQEIHLFLPACWCGDEPAERPGALLVHVEILLSYPVCVLVLWMSPPRPFPQGLEDEVICFSEGGLAAHVPVIVGPAPDEGGEFQDEFPGAAALIGVDGRPDLVQKALEVLAGRLDDEFAVIAAHVLSQKVKTIGDVGQFGFLC